MNSQLREVSRDYLLSLKSSHSKLFNLNNDYKLQKYLTSDKISTEQKQTLFMLRTRMVDVKSNFSEKYGNILTCHFCTEEESQSHLLICTQITVGIDTSGVKHDDIFGNLEMQEKVARVFTKILKQRNMMLKTLSH